MYLRNCWYVAATGDELGRKPLSRRLLGEPLVLFRTDAGIPLAMFDVCPHRSLPLSMGEVVGDRLRCGYHGLEFEPGGACVRIPAQTHIPRAWRVKTYPLVDRWRWVWIWMGDPARADPARIPDMHWNDDPAWTYTGGHFEIKCDYQLLVDNLLDLSHETFVHRSTIGNDAVAETPVETTVEGQTVRVDRLMRNCPPPPLYQKLRSFPGNIDRSQKIRFAPPSHIVIASRSTPHGNNDPDAALEYRVVNGITPASESVCHHFWSVPRNFAHDPDVTAMFHKGSVTAFSEDIVVLEAQQAAMREHGASIRWQNFNADAGGVAARRIVDALSRQEAGEGQSS
ncbi:MAG TPA: aromatic ring-hydroxylating dioxygenase subunit alpha [Stellaceae bacterium]|nr:aromatic ring-hydroxylating dioxygenase subunit alpha [Stellaceae bacterium]